MTASSSKSCFFINYRLQLCTSCRLQGDDDRWQLSNVFFGFLQIQHDSFTSIIQKIYLTVDSFAGSRIINFLFRIIAVCESMSYFWPTPYDSIAVFSLKITLFQHCADDSQYRFNPILNDFQVDSLFRQEYYGRWQLLRFAVNPMDIAWQLLA